MRSRLPVVVCALVAVLALRAEAQQQLSIYASVVDGTGTPVASLQPTDVRLMEDGTQVKVVKIEPIEWPVKLQLLVDNGTGLGAANLNHLRTGLKGLIEALPPGVELTIVTTSPQPRFVLRPTTDRAMQLDGVGKVAPDSSAGRFVESLNEAMQRFEKDKTEYFPVIVSVGSTFGDRNVQERDINQLMDRLEKRPTTVHVVILSGGSASASAGVVQTEVGLSVTQYTKGRYEGIAAASRIATLLPEIGAQVAKSHTRQGKQFKITAERASGASGPLGKITMATLNGLSTTGLSMDGRLP